MKWCCGRIKVSPLSDGSEANIHPCQCPHPKKQLCSAPTHDSQCSKIQPNIDLSNHLLHNNPQKTRQVSCLWDVLPAFSFGGAFPGVLLGGTMILLCCVDILLDVRAKTRSFS